MTRPLLWRTRRTDFDLSRRGMIMGILNVTPDSFSDGGKHNSAEAAVEHGLRMEAEGAEIIDIGGESTRPEAAEVSAEEEMDRVLPVIRALRERSGICISIDTMKAAVAEAAVQAGADVINDVSGLAFDPGMADVAARTGAGLVLMHMQGNPRTMQKAPHYDDVVGEVRAALDAALGQAEDAGVAREAVALDPGIGFGKTLEHNLALLRGLDQFTAAGRPILLGASRKSFLGRLLGSSEMSDRFWPTVAMTTWSRESGARILRVHEVRENVQALRMTEAILNGPTASCTLR